ncbi:MAG: hypothetical protein MUC35_06645 [Candidatus Margulisbacteria bacterium]|jgi:4-amino-4-deoxy-L-arabinose transferase-like glycosyltransferase|nr:hypothetical protein [Candidatus Margulisiibacteriota bacterium]
MKKTWLIILLILLVQGALRLPFLSEPLNLDESTYTQIAVRMSQGEYLYRDLVDVKPPLLFDLYRLIGWSDPGLRLYMAAFALLTTLLVLQAGWLWGGKKVGLAGAALFALFSGGVFIEGTSASAENLMLPFLVAALNCTLLGGWWVGLAGICSGAALMIKQTALFNLVGLAGYLLWRRRWPESGRFLAGAAVVPVFYLLQSWLRGDLPVMFNALFGLSGGMLKFSLGNVLFRTAFIFVFENSLLWLLAGLGFFYLRRQAWTEKNGLLLGWTAAALVGVYATGYALGHYFGQLIPALALLGGLAVGNWPAAAGTGKKGVYWLLLLATLALFTIANQYEFYFVYSGDQIAARRYGSEAIPKFRRIGERIRALTGPGDQVYGFPVAVHYSGRRQPVKYYLTVKGGRSEVRLFGRLIYAHDFGIDRGPALTRLIDEDIYQAIIDRRTKYLVFGLMNAYLPPRLKEVITTNGYAYDRELSDPEALIYVYKR